MFEDSSRAKVLTIYGNHDNLEVLRKLDILMKDGIENLDLILVNKELPRMSDDPLPWSILENPIPRLVTAGTSEFPVTRTDYVHITSISPKQRVCAIILKIVLKLMKINGW